VRSFDVVFVYAWPPRTDINQNVPLTMFDKFHRNVNLLKFQKPIQLPVSSNIILPRRLTTLHVASPYCRL